MSAHADPAQTTTQATAQTTAQTTAPSSGPSSAPRPHVAVIGGGYGGVAVAQALDDLAEVTLVEARDTFVHNVAALRALVDAEWTDRIFFPYTRLLAHGTVRHDRAVHVDGASVTLASGDRLTPDYTVLATGSGYPFPAKTDAADSATAAALIHAAREQLAASDRVLLLGAGPVGMELAGEIRAAWPARRVTLLDPADDILAGFPDAFRRVVRAELDALGIELVLGSALKEDPHTAPGTHAPFTAVTGDGREVAADLWFRCHGVAPATGYLDAALADAVRRPDGHLRVTPELRLPGHERIFALGDITDVPEAKTAKAAGEHAAVVAANIRALAEGGPGAALTAHAPGAPAIALPLGPERGASYAPDMGILDAATTSEIKGDDLMIAPYTEIFGLT